MVVSGDNENCLFLWEDNTGQIQNANLLNYQEQMVYLDQLKIYLRDKNFQSALKYSFQKNLKSHFFNVINDWMCFCNNKSDVIYNFDFESDKKD